MNNEKIKKIIYLMSAVMFLLISFFLISTSIYKSIIVSRNVEVIDSWIEKKTYQKWTGQWKLLEKNEEIFYYLELKDEEGKKLILNYLPNDFYFLIKKKNFVYCESIKKDIFTILISNMVFRIFYIILFILDALFLFIFLILYDIYKERYI